MIGIRGAIASVENSEENILESSKILFTEIIEKNNLVGHVLGRWSEKEKILTKNAFKLALKEMVKFLETSQFQNVSFSVTKPE